MKTRLVTDNDLPDVAQWFASLAWTIPPGNNVMPQTGFLTELSDGRAAACGFLYTTGTAVAFLYWTATNPLVPSEDQNMAMGQLLEHVKEKCLSIGVTHLMVLTKSFAFAQKITSHGFRASSGFIKLTWVAP